MAFYESDVNVMLEPDQQAMVTSASSAFTKLPNKDAVRAEGHDGCAASPGSSRCSRSCARAGFKAKYEETLNAAVIRRKTVGL